MKKAVLLWLLVFCTSISDAQIKTQREYDYISNEVNNAGLRVVGLKSEDYNRTGWKVYGCIDKNGSEVIPIKFGHISLRKGQNYILATELGYSENYGPHTLFSENGRRTIAIGHRILITPQTYRKYNCTIVIGSNKKYGLTNSNSEVVVSPVYDNMHWMDEESGLLAVSQNGAWSIIDYKGNEILNTQFQGIGGRDDTNLPFPAKKDNKIGYIDITGKTVIPFMYNDYYLQNDFIGVFRLGVEEYQFRKGIATVYGKNNKWGAIDQYNNIVIPFTYDLLAYYDGRTMWACKNGKYALIDNKGKEIIPFKKYGKNPEAYAHNGDVKAIIPDIKSSQLADKMTKIFFDDNGNEYSSYDDAKRANIMIRGNEEDIKDNLAVLDWLNSFEQYSQQLYELHVGIKSDSKIENVSISVNGVFDRGIKTVETNDYDLTINKTITLNEGENTIKVSVTNAVGTTQEEKTIVYRPQGGELPTIEWLDFAVTANKKEYQMKLGIKSKTKVEEVNVTVNGELTRGIKTVTTDGYDLTVDRTLSLIEGLNRIVVSVRNCDGISTSEKVITYQGNNPTPVFNDKRIALVIGNSEYQGNINSLANPRNDAEDITSKLKSLGFEVKVLYDGTKKGMNEAINSFVVQARNYDVALFYYAGHGLQLQTDIGGANYLIPVDVNLVYKSDAEHDCVNANRIVSQMEASGCKVRLVVLDACRDLPNLLDSNRGTSPTGFSEIKSVVGTYILYSTREGKTASDGKGRNSPFAEGILKYIDVPNQPVERFFKNVGAWVDQVTNNKQNPWPSGRINGDFYFNKQ